MNITQTKNHIINTVEGMDNPDVLKLISGFLDSLKSKQTSSSSSAIIEKYKDRELKDKFDLDALKTEQQYKPENVKNMVGAFRDLITDEQVKNEH